MCQYGESAPVPTLTLAELRNEINLSEQRLQTSMEQQQKQYVQQQHLLVQLNTDVNNMKESVNKVGSKLESLPPEPPKPMAIPTEVPGPEPGSHRRRQAAGRRGGVDLG